VAAMGTRDILDDCPAAWITDSTVDDFASKIVTLLNNPARLNELKRHAVLHAKQWDARVLAQKMIAFYERIIREQQ